MVMYGPYSRPDGRLHVIHYDSNTGKRRTQSYPRYLMEQKLGRELTSDEHVDHIDGDRTNNDIENFQILSYVENNRKSIIERGISKKWGSFICPTCENEFMLSVSRYTGNQVVQKKKGPYCSRRCAGMAK